MKLSTLEVLKQAATADLPAPMTLTLDEAVAVSGGYSLAQLNVAWNLWWHGLPPQVLNVGAQVQLGG
jgi:hypothetical protein